MHGICYNSLPALLGGSTRVRNVYSFFFSFLTKLVRRRNDIKEFCVLNLSLLPNLALFTVIKPSKNLIKGGFPGGAVVKNPPANAGDMGSSPGPGRSHMLWST